MTRSETIRQCILDELYGYRPTSRDTEHMAKNAKRSGDLPDATPAEFDRECAYLAGKGLIERTEREYAPGTARWTITSAGIDYLEREGLV